MKCWSIPILFATVGVALAAPKSLEERHGNVCQGVFASARCCLTDVQGVATNICHRVPKRPKDAVEFQRLCAGMVPRCCVLPVPGWANLCQGIEL